MFKSDVSSRSYQFIVFTYPIRGLVALLTRLAGTLFFKKIILVFGMSRSGTSMLAEFMSIQKSSVYIHEPDTDLMKYRFSLEGNTHFTQKQYWDFVNSEEQKEFKVHLLVCVTLLAILKSGFSVRTICIKPISLLNVIEESSNTLKGAIILYICRHPAGRSESILRQLKHDQNIEGITNTDLEMLGREWGQANRHMQELFKRYPSWYWVVFEKLANDPIKEFKALYERFKLPWSNAIENEIQQKTTGEDGGFYEVKRNSRAQADKWRTALTEDQVQAIRKGCLPFETNLYESF